MAATSPGRLGPPQATVPCDRLFATFPWLSNWQTLSLLYVILALAASLQALFRTNFHNDFDIFRLSFIHLINGTGLYIPYPTEQVDLFKYSPTFALFMAPFSVAPKWIALPLWNLLNASAPLVAVYWLALPQRAKAFILLFSAPELLGNLQNGQSNGLVAGLLIAAFGAFEKGRPRLAALLIVFNVHVKILGIAIVAIFLVYKNRNVFILFLFVFGLVLTLLPGLVIGFDNLVDQYVMWWRVLVSDHQINHNTLSIMGIVNEWFDLSLPNSWFQVLGVILLLAPLLKIDNWGDRDWRYRFLSSALMWVVIFNHKAGGEGFVVAMLGVAIWSVVEPASIGRSCLLTLAFLFTSVASSDIVPRPLRRAVPGWLGLKALPIVVVWAQNAWRLSQGQTPARNQ